MMRFARETVLAAALATCACTSNSKEQKSGDASPGAGGAPPDAASEAGNALTGFRLDWALADGTSALDPDAGGAMLPGLEGAKVCVSRHPEITCATTAADGSFELRHLPPRADLVLTFDKEGFIKESKTIQTSSTDMNVPGNKIVMFPRDGAPTPDGVTLDESKGSVDFFAIGPSPSDPSVPTIISGVTVSIGPGNARPYYYDTKGKPVADATTTLGGFGFFFNLDPGDYVLTFVDPRYDCAPISAPIAGWGIPELPNKVKFTVTSGYLTEELAVLCTEKSVIVEGDGG